MQAMAVLTLGLLGSFWFVMFRRDHAAGLRSPTGRNVDVKPGDAAGPEAGASDDR
jgi:hypothetical protein